MYVHVHVRVRVCVHVRTSKQRDAPVLQARHVGGDLVEPDDEHVQHGAVRCHQKDGGFTRVRHAALGLDPVEAKPQQEQPVHFPANRLQQTPVQRMFTYVRNTLS